MRSAPNGVAARGAAAILKDLHDPSQIDRVVKDNPSNVVLLLMAEMRRASQETGRLIEKLFDKDLLIVPGKKGGWVVAGMGDDAGWAAGKR